MAFGILATDDWLQLEVTGQTLYHHQSREILIYGQRYLCQSLNTDAQSANPSLKSWYLEHPPETEYRVPTANPRK